MAMTLEQVRDALYAIHDEERPMPMRKEAREWAEVIGKHITQPAQAVDVGAIHRVIRSMCNSEYVEGRHVLADILHKALAGEQAGGVGDDAVERLAKYICQQESRNCTTLDAAIHHRSTWRRVIPEARAMLEAALLPASPTTDKETQR